MILEIKKYPNPILRKKAAEVKEISDEIRVLAKDMIETMAQKDGLGLAAPQVNQSKRIIVLRGEKEPVVFINPRIAGKSKEKEIREEGCLSFPGVWVRIKRQKEVEIEAIGLEGREMKIGAVGLFARIIQHEIDHLNGKLIIDRLNIFQRLKLKFHASNRFFNPRRLA